MNNRVSAIIIGGALLVMTGCQHPQKQSSAWTKISQLEDERIYLKKTIEDLHQENKQLKEQFSNLANLKGDVRIELLTNLERIAIDNRSGFFDKDDDGTEETLITYIKTYDDAGDVVKAAGDVNLQLWDLSKKGEEALLGEWNVTAKELKLLWMGMMMTDYYRLSYNVASKLDDKQKELTIKVKFTDYLTGKVFTEQKVVKRSL
ncbi:MAG: hypothetical protein K9M75_08975 [Phycisphaerae bacterium]|nr:hypothetical protein [Phycisphaerae bacterium]